MKTALAFWSAVSLGAFALSGCISHEEVVYHDPARMPVQFESDKAARIFYEALSRQTARRNMPESRTEVEIPVVFKHKHRVVSGENAAFNDAVQRCDTNKDGKITELEAQIFAEQAQKR